jgi:uncharacterized protein YciI
MKKLFAVTRTPCPAWEPGKPREEQAGWPEHADFMNNLAAEGFVILGGPIGDGRDAFLIVDAADKETLNATLSGDPWSLSGHLKTAAVQPWTILLDASQGRNQPRRTS